MANRCIALLGGTFDPVHIGHLRAAVELRDCIRADRVHLIVNHLPPHREQPLASAEQRLAMVKAGIGKTEGLYADDREIVRADWSYTVDTLASLREEYGLSTCLVMAIGLDVLKNLNNWHAPEQLFQYAHIVVVERPATEVVMNSELSALIQAHQATDLSTLLSKPCGDFLHLPLPTALSISATKIRQFCAEQRSIRYLVPESVERLIEQFNLYQA